MEEKHARPPLFISQIPHHCQGLNMENSTLAQWLTQKRSYATIPTGRHILSTHTTLECLKHLEVCLGGEGLPAPPLHSALCVFLWDHTA